MLPVTESIRRLFATGKTVVTPLFVGAITGKPILTVMVPAMSGTTVAYAVGITIQAERLAETLREQKLPADWVSSICTSRIQKIALRERRGVGGVRCAHACERCGVVMCTGKGVRKPRGGAINVGIGILTIKLRQEINRLR